MSLPLEATTAAESDDAGLDAWFTGLGDEFAGRIPVGSLRPRMVEGWRLLWRGRELEIQVDADFPFSVARAYLVGYSRAKAEPHVERDGKLCLATKAVPSDRLRTVQAVVTGAKVIIAGCGALGSGVARMLAQAGVEHLRLVDPEDLGWENIRRHELGALAVGTGKAKSLADSIRASLPAIRLVEGFASTFATFAREHPEALKAADLVISCTGEWAADASVEDALSQPGQNAVAIYGWMEPHALATHAVLIGKGNKFADGFDDQGLFRLPTAAGGKPPPAECGGASTTFGAVELAHAQALVARLAIDALRGLASPPAWRSWLADAAAFQEADASVTSSWAAARGQPDAVGGPYEGDWTFS